MAFCALIHRFRPDLIDYESLSPNNVFENCKLAFEVAERELNIPAFLEADDMARLKVPDKLSVITYVSQYYNFLNPLPQLGGPGVKGKVKASTGTKRPPDNDHSTGPSSKKSTTNAKENANPAIDTVRTGSLGDKCAICQNKVYLLERHIELGKLFHRSCYRHSEMSPTSKVYTRSPFLSPSLSTEAPLSPSYVASEARAGHGDVVATVKEDSRMSKPSEVKPSATSEHLPSSKRVETAGMKHSLPEPDRDDTKKSKFQPKNIFSAKTAIKDRLESLKAKYSEHGSSSSENALPLSSKEANKLEKRNQEILSAEKTAASVQKGTKRNVPLIFQHKEADISEKGASSTSLVLPSSSSKYPNLSASASAVDSSSSGVKSAAAPRLTTSSAQNSGSSRQLEDKPEETEKHLDAVTAEVKPKLDTVQSKSVPMAKPRSVIPKQTSAEDLHSSKTSLSPSKDSTPKPVPRKIKTEAVEKKQAPERPKELPHVKLYADQESKTSPLSPPCGSPPPLPSTAPPSVLPHPNTDNEKPVVDTTHIRKQHEALPQDNLRSKLIHNKSTEGKELDRRLSTPLPVSSEITLSVERKNEGQVLTGLLASLSQVRGRAASTPSISATPSKSSALSLHSDSLGKNGASFLHSDSTIKNGASSLHSDSTIKNGSSSLHSDSMIKNGASSVHSDPTIKNGASSVHSDSTIKNGSSSLHNESAVKSGLSSLHNDSMIKSSSSLHNDSTDPVKKTGLLAHLKFDSNEGAVSSQNSLAKDVKSKKDMLNSYTSKSMLNTHTDSNSAPAVRATGSFDLTPKPSNTPHKTNEPFTIAGSLKPGPGASKTQHQLIPDDSSQTKPKSSTTLVGILKNSGTKVNVGDMQGASYSVSKPGISENTNNGGILKNSGTKVNVGDMQGASNSVSKPGISENSKNVSSQITEKKDSAKIDLKVTSNKESTESTKVTDTSLQLSNIKLKRVMPERREVKKASDAPVFDVHLKKVDDTPVKPSRPSKSNISTVSQPALSETHKDTLAKTFSNEAQKDNLVKTFSNEANKNIPSKISSNEAHKDLSSKKSAFEAPKDIGIKISARTDDTPNEVSVISSKSEYIPQWKVDIEERKKRLREEMARSEIVSMRSKFTSQKNDRKERPKSDDVSILLKDSEMSNVVLNNKNVSKVSGNLSPRRKSVDVLGIRGTESDIEQILNVKAKLTKPRTSNEFDQGTEKLDWQVEAEKRSAALAARVNGEVKKDTARVLPQVPAEDQSNRNESRIKKLEIKVGGEDKKQNEKNVEQKSKNKFQDLIIPPDVNKKLKSFEAHNIVNIQIEHKTPTEENGSIVEDFREKLRQLKHVEVDKVQESVDSLGNEELKNAKAHKETIMVTRHLLNNTNNNSKLTDNDHIARLEHNPPEHNPSEHNPLLFHTISLDDTDVLSEEGKTKEEKTLINSEAHYSKETAKTHEEPETSKFPKVKRKITVLGSNHMNKSEPLPSTPNRLKKIEVGTKFSFDHSLDVESSLSDSTQSMTIQDVHTPKQQVPTHFQEKVKSPHHISAIELQQQLLDIDKKLNDLELRGRDLEDSIRQVNTYEEEDELMLEWFTLVSEKNDLVRKEADLVYISKEQELEDDQDQIESQLRYIMTIPEESKSPAEKQEEEYLIKKKLELVEQRNRIVDSMDEDRLRYQEEDRHLAEKLKGKGFLKNPSATLIAQKGKKVAKSKFYT
ncbi:uncharacterized protein LOC131953269 isoform X2 [Physella acuta]|nr:uncharacterized protein LOC131953269 isoform X2 [Physella acuta]